MNITCPNCELGWDKCLCKNEVKIRHTIDRTPGRGARNILNTGEKIRTCESAHQKIYLDTKPRYDSKHRRLITTPRVFIIGES